MSKKYTNKAWPRPLIGLLMCLSLAGLAQAETAASAPPGRPAAMASAPSHEAHDWHARRDALRLSEEQRAQIHQIMEQGREQAQQHRQALHELHQQQARLLGADPIDTAALEANRQQMLKLHDDMSAHRLQQHIAISQVLKPEQRAHMAARLAHGMGMHGHHRHGHHGWHHHHRRWHHHHGHHHGAHGRDGARSWHHEGHPGEQAPTAPAGKSAPRAKSAASSPAPSASAAKR